MYVDAGNGEKKSAFFVIGFEITITIEVNNVKIEATSGERESEHLNF